MRAAEGVFMVMLLKMNVGDVTVALIHAYLQVCSADLVHVYANVQTMQNRSFLFSGPGTLGGAGK